MKKSVFFISFILIGFAVQAENKSEMMEKYFNHKEIQRLNQLVNDFDKHIISNYSQSGDFVLAWQSFFEALATDPQSSAESVAVTIQRLMHESSFLLSASQILVDSLMT